MSNKTIIIVAVLIIILGLAGFFLFKRSTSNLTQEVQLPQPLTLSEEPQSNTSLSEPTSQSELITEATTQTTTGEIASETQPISQSETQNIVIYTDSGYSPNNLKIKVGETVVFKNQSSQAMWPASDLHPTHRVYSGTSLQEHCPDTTGTAFDACTGIQPGNSWSFTFNKKGTWKYHDHLNPSHTGTIVVE